MSEVNTYKAIGFLMTFLPEPVGDYMKAAQAHLRELVDAYDALAPDWNSAPEWAQWYAVDKIGATFFATEPYADEEECCWFFSNDGNQPEPIEINVVILPDHIDWRDCKWHRPEVTK